MENRDHVFVLGFDDTEAIRGLERFEKRLSKLGTGVGPISPRTGLGSSRRSQTVNTSINPDVQLRLERSLDRYRAKLQATWKTGTAESKQYLNTLDRIRSATKSATSRRDLIKLNEQFKDLRQNSTLSAQAIRKNNAALKQGGFAANSMANSVKNLVKSYVSVFAVIEGGRRLFKAGKQMDALNAAMLAGSPSIEAAGENMKFVEDVADRLNVNIIQAGQGFAKLGASGRAAGISNEKIKETFLAAAEAARTFGLDAGRTNLVFLAFSQMMSKGKISSEELRRQLAEQLPGVMAVAAKSMNKTTDEFEAMLRAGLVSEEFFKRFPAELRKFVRNNGALEASIQKVQSRQEGMNNAFILFSRAVFNGGAAKLLGSLFDTIATAVRGLTAALNGLGHVFEIFDNFVNGVFNITVDGTNTGFSILKNTLVGLTALIAGRYVKSLAIALVGTNAMTAASGRWAKSLLFVKAALKSLLFATGIGAAFAIGGWALEKVMSNSGNQSGNSKVEHNTQNNVGDINIQSNDPIAVANGVADLFSTNLGSRPTAAGL